MATNIAPPNDSSTDDHDDLGEWLRAARWRGERAAAASAWLAGLSPTVPHEVEPPTSPRLLNVDEAAAYVGCHSNTVYAAVKRGDLAARRVGRLVRFTIEDLDQWTRPS
jgi:excisionase family DNA binding protein